MVAARRAVRLRGRLALELWLVGILLVLAHGPAFAQEQEPVEAERLEHMLAYLAADYAMSASSTASQDQGESGESEEHTRLADQVRRMAAGLALPPAVARRVLDVSQLVKRTAPASEVSAAVDDLRAMLIATFRLPVSPNAPPSAEHGRALFQQYCATCHGTTGRADTERAASLKPRPANFLDPAVGEALSPYRIVTTVRFGVDGTPMVPFGFLGEADRWDLGFYTIGLRHVAPPAEEGPLYAVTELANLSDAELRADLRAGGVREALVEPVLTQLRQRAPFQDWARRDALAVARTELESARLATVGGEREAALRAARDANDKGVLPVLAALGHVDHALARDTRRALAAVLAQMDRQASPADVNAGIALALRTIVRAERALWRSYGGRSPASATVGDAALLVARCAGAIALVVALLGALSSLGVAGASKATRSVHRGWMWALPLGVAPPLLAPRLVARSSGVEGAIEGALSFFAVAALLYLMWCARRQRLATALGSAALFTASFALTYRDAFAAAAFFPSLVASTGRPLPVVAGVGIGVGLLLLFALTIARAVQRSPRRLALWMSSVAVGGLAFAFVCQGMAAFYYLLPDR
jgi:high-affinity iron transporter